MLMMLNLPALGLYAELNSVDELFNTYLFLMLLRLSSLFSISVDEPPVKSSLLLMLLMPLFQATFMPLNLVFVDFSMVLLQS